METTNVIALPARREYWARRINDAWQATLEAVFRTGRELIAAKDELPHGEFIKMVETDLSFSRQTAWRLRAIAGDKRLTNVTHVHHLPRSWGTLYELTKLDDEEFRTLIDDGTICPDAERDDIIVARRSLQRNTKQEEHRTHIVGGLVDDLQKFIATGYRVGTIYADPPWLYDNQVTRSAASSQYYGMTFTELCDLPVGDLAWADAHLHVWTTNGFLRECLDLIEAWGFEFKSTFVWVKPDPGIGNYWRNSHEFLLTAVRGDATRFADHNLRSWFECKRGRHSGKPEQVRDFIERASPKPWIELFARHPAPNWLSWGHEIRDSLLAQGLDTIE